MKNIYIFDEYVSSLQNGIGTFLGELICCFQTLDANICLIEFNTPNKAFTMTIEKDIRRLQFPVFYKNGFLANYRIIDKFLRLYIQDSITNLFMLNHSPCEDLLKTIKTSFPLSKISFTIHDLGWTHRLFGDIAKMHCLVCDNVNLKKNTSNYRLVKYFREEQRMYSICDRVICLSTETQNALIELYNIPQEKISLIPNGLQDEDTYLLSKNARSKLRKRKGIKKDEKLLLFSGRVTEVKGAIVLLKSFKKILSKYPGSKLLVTGSIFDFSLISTVSKDIALKIGYTGLISKKELSKWYQIADVGIIPSYTEQCTYTGIEMMKYGLPVVASDGFGLKSMFENGVNSMVVEVGNRSKGQGYANRLTQAVLELLNSNSLQNDLREQARKTYELKYHSEIMKNGYQRLLKELF